ncbi:MAG: hypothetical protein ACON39_00855 [Coraliomargaritaceae bacterium]
MLKKNPVFVSLIAVCLVAFGAIAFLAFSANGQKAKVNRQLKQAQQQLNSLLNAETSLTEKNVAASEANIAELDAELERMSSELSRGSQLAREEDGVRVIASIQQYISDSQRQAEENVNADGEAAPVDLPSDFAFGFDAFFDETEVPDSVEEIVYLNNQRQVLEYILEKLFAASPDSIESVAREAFPGNLEDSKSDRSLFSVGDAVTAAREGAIKTLGFEIAFTGNTNSLRSFLSELNRFEYPIVVRSVDVERPSGEETTVAPRQSGGLEDIFGVFGSQESSIEDRQAAADELAKPVISGNTSRFTIVMEYFQVVVTGEEAETTPEQES